MYKPGKQSLCVICGATCPDYRFTCSWDCHEKFEKLIEMLGQEFQEKIDDIEKIGKDFREKQ